MHKLKIMSKQYPELDFHRGTINDYLQMSVRKEQKDTLNKHSVEQLINNSEYCLCVRYKGIPLFMYGIISILPHVGEWWGIFDEKIVRCTQQKRGWISFLKWLKGHINSLPYLRIHSLIQSDFQSAKRMVEFFGLESEGILKKIGPDRKDYNMYALIKD